METTNENTEVNNNELINIKHKSMAMNGNTWPEKSNSHNLSTLDLFLENEKNSNAHEPWSKLDKTNKNKKLVIFAEKYKEEKQLSEIEYNRLLTFFKDCLVRKKLQRVKDVIYDKVSGVIKDVPDKTVVIGYPAISLKEFLRNFKK